MSGNFRWFPNSCLGTSTLQAPACHAHEAGASRNGGSQAGAWEPAKYCVNYDLRGRK